MTDREEASGTRDWLPVGEEPQPVGSITHLLVLKGAETSLVSLPSGDVDAETEPASGLYHNDTRYLSRLRFTLGGLEPVLLDAREVEHGSTAVFCNPTLRTPNGQLVPAQTLIIRRKRVLIEGMLEVLSISNYGTEPVDVELRADFDADFRDIFEVRGFERTGPREPVTKDVGQRSVTFRYVGGDRIERRTLVRFGREPDRLTESRAVFRFTLQPRELVSIDVAVMTERGLSEYRFNEAVALVRQQQRTWLDESTQIITDDEGVNRLLTRSLLDVQALRGRVSGIEYIAAGAPWYDCLFGRDSLITGMEMLPFRPQTLAASLRVLAHYQATHTDPARDAQPGKIPHELRWGELANTGEVPFGQYYGSVDATALFIVAAYEYSRWTGDALLIRELWPNIQRAYEWCIRECQSNPHGFLAYKRATAVGLENQGWKDSHDAIVWPDGRLATPPIALVEVQAYLCAALNAYVRLAKLLGEPVPAEVASRPKAFSGAFEAAFGHDDLGYVLCLDGDGKPVPTPASNAGHVLWMGAASRTRAAQVADMLMGNDMFSGWGIRTLSSRVVGFNPLGYHVGSVWPHDNALILAGLRLYGFDSQALELADAMLQMGLAFPENRVPELFSGDAREFRVVPTPYPVASRPQAWSAASIPFVMATMLGLRPGEGSQLKIVRPQLPLHLREVEVRNLRIAGGQVDLRFRRLGSNISVEVERIVGDVEVVLASRWLEEETFSAVS